MPVGNPMRVVAVNILGPCPSSPKAISTSLFQVTIHIVDGDAGSRKRNWQIWWSCSFLLRDNQIKLAVGKSSGNWDMQRPWYYEHYNLPLITTLRHVGILQLHPDQFVVSINSGLSSWLGRASLSSWQPNSHHHSFSCKKFLCIVTYGFYVCVWRLCCIYCHFSINWVTLLYLL